MFNYPIYPHVKIWSDKKMSELLDNLKPFSFKAYEDGAEVVTRVNAFKVVKIFDISECNLKEKYIAVLERISDKFIIAYSYDERGKFNADKSESSFDIFIKPKITIKYANIYDKGGISIVGPMTTSKIDAKLIRRKDLKYVGLATIEVEE